MFGAGPAGGRPPPCVFGSQLVRSPRRVAMSSLLSSSWSALSMIVSEGWFMGPADSLIVSEGALRGPFRPPGSMIVSEGALRGPLGPPGSMIVSAAGPGTPPGCGMGAERSARTVSEGRFMGGAGWSAPAPMPPDSMIVSAGPEPRPPDSMIVSDGPPPMPPGSMIVLAESETGAPAGRAASKPPPPEGAGLPPKPGEGLPPKPPGPGLAPKPAPPGLTPKRPEPGRCGAASASRSRSSSASGAGRLSGAESSSDTMVASASGTWAPVSRGSGGASAGSSVRDGICAVST